MLEKIAADPTCSFLVLVPSLLLVAQIGNKIEGAVLVGTGFACGEESSFRERVANAQVVVCCYNSVGLLDRYFEYVIIDEAHHVFKP